jgi:hypothetical protein
MTRENKQNGRSGLERAIRAGVLRRKCQPRPDALLGIILPWPAGRSRPRAPTSYFLYTSKKQVFALRGPGERSATPGTCSQANTSALTMPRSVRTCRDPSGSQNRSKKAILGAIKSASRGSNPQMHIDDLLRNQLSTTLFLQCGGVVAKKHVLEKVKEELLAAPTQDREHTHETTHKRKSRRLFEKIFRCDGFGRIAVFHLSENFIR